MHVTAYVTFSCLNITRFYSVSCTQHLLLPPMLQVALHRMISGDGERWRRRCESESRRMRVVLNEREKWKNYQYFYYGKEIWRLLVLVLWSNTKQLKWQKYVPFY